MLSTNFTSVNESGLRIHSPFNPLGKSYDFNQIEAVKTGFEEKNGAFYYKIKIDGKEATFSTPTVNGKLERYENESYLELEDFDQRLMDLGIKKESSEENSKKSKLDQKYINRFLKIIRNSPSL